MATVKKSKVKNLSAGPSKKTPIAPKVDPKGQFTKVQERTLGNMRKGGSIKKAQVGDKVGKSLRSGRNKINVTDTSGFAAGKISGYPASLIVPHRKGATDTIPVTVNRKMVNKAIGKHPNFKKGGKTKKK